MNIYIFKNLTDRTQSFIDYGESIGEIVDRNFEEDTFNKKEWSVFWCRMQVAF